MSDDLNGLKFDYVKYSPLILGIFLILVGLCGIFYSFKKSKCTLIIYDLGVLILSIIFISLAVFCFAAITNNYGVSLEKISSCEVSYMKKANEMSIYA